MKAFIFLVSVLVSLQGFSQSINNDISLKSVMKEMGPAFKSLAGNISNPAANDESLQLAEFLGEKIHLALTLVPETVTQASEAERPQLLAKFRDIMGRLYVADISLQLALLRNDNNAAKQSVKLMSEIKSEGHQLFSPPPL